MRDMPSRRTKTKPARTRRTATRPSVFAREFLSPKTQERQARKRAAWLRKYGPDSFPP